MDERRNCNKRQTHVSRSTYQATLRGIFDWIKFPFFSIRDYNASSFKGHVWRNKNMLLYYIVKCKYTNARRIFLSKINATVYKYNYNILYVFILRILRKLSLQYF